MSTIKPTALSAGLITPKDQALNAPVSGPVRSMTLKLDDVRYRQLKLLGLARSKSSQDLLSEAVDLLLRGRP